MYWTVYTIEIAISVIAYCECFYDYNVISQVCKKGLSRYVHSYSMLIKEIIEYHVHMLANYSMDQRQQNVCTCMHR